MGGIWSTWIKSTLYIHKERTYKLHAERGLRWESNFQQVCSDDSSINCNLFQSLNVFWLIMLDYYCCTIIKVWGKFLNLTIRTRLVLTLAEQYQKTWLVIASLKRGLIQSNPKGWNKTTSHNCFWIVHYIREAPHSLTSENVAQKISQTETYNEYISRLAETYLNIISKEQQYILYFAHWKQLWKWMNDKSSYFFPPN